MFVRVIKSSLAMAALLALSACAVRVVDGSLRDLATYYDDARATPENGQPVALNGTYSEAFRNAVTKLRKQDFAIVTADEGEGLLVVRSADPNLLTCGELQSGPVGKVPRYAANSPLAIIEVPSEGAGSTFVRREFSSLSEITIRFSVDPEQNNAVFATISELHNATIRMSQLTDGSVFYNETIAFDGTTRGRFTRGVICGSARAMRAAIR